MEEQLLQGILAEYRLGFINTVENINSEISSSITEAAYWRGMELSKTRRSNGQVIRGGFRDIVDTGELLQSQDLTYDFSNPSVMEANISFSAPHYKYVRFGTRHTPARDFVGRGYHRAVPFDDLGAEVVRNSY
jgi:hypothetical protein